MIPFCETPRQSVVAGVIGGLLGGAVGISLGFGFVGVALFAGALGGLGDLSFHMLRGDDQFKKAVGTLRR